MVPYGAPHPTHLIHTYPLIHIHAAQDDQLPPSDGGRWLTDMLRVFATWPRLGVLGMNTYRLCRTTEYSNRYGAVAWRAEPRSGVRWNFAQVEIGERGGWGPPGLGGVQGMGCLPITPPTFPPLRVTGILVLLPSPQNKDCAPMAPQLNTSTEQISINTPPHKYVCSPPNPRTWTLRPWRCAPPSTASWAEWRRAGAARASAAFGPTG